MKVREDWFVPSIFPLLLGKKIKGKNQLQYAQPTAQMEWFLQFYLKTVTEYAKEEKERKSNNKVWWVTVDCSFMA